jgi:hypothetical protein
MHNAVSATPCNQLSKFSAKGKTRTCNTRKITDMTSAVATWQAHAMTQNLDEQLGNQHSKFALLTCSTEPWLKKRTADVNRNLRTISET